MDDAAVDALPSSPAEEAREAAMKLHREAVDAHCRAASMFLDRGANEDAAEELESAAILLETTDIKRSIELLEQATRFYGEAANDERAAENAERCARLLLADRQDAIHIARQFMLAKNHFGNAGLYEASGKMYVAEMNARTEIEWLSIWAPSVKLRRRLGHLTNWMGLTAWRITCLHGEGLGRLVLVVSLVLLSFAWLYWRFDALGPTHPTFLDALVYSATTMPTFGVTTFDMSLGHPWPLIATAEAYLGTAALGLFTSILVRKLSRR